MKIRIPIAMKLVAMAMCLLLVAGTAITYKITERLESDAITAAREEGLAEAESKSDSVETLLSSYVAKAKIIASLLAKEYPTPEERRAAMELSFFQDADFISVAVVPNKALVGNDRKMLRVVQYSYLKTFGIQESAADQYMDMVRSTHKFPIDSVFARQIEVRNSSLPDGVPILTIGFSLSRNEYDEVEQAVIADIRLDRFQAAFAEQGLRLRYLIDSRGAVLAHPDDTLAMRGANLSRSEFVAKALSSKLAKGEIPFTGHDGESYFGAFAKNNFGVTVLSQVKKSTVVEPALDARYEAVHITGLALSAALFFVFLFSMTLSTPVERLLEITREIAKGNFDVHAQSTVRSHDEVGELATAFDQMTVGLKERDKVKQMFSKFHGSSVADDILSNGDASLRGTSREVTVFFSDIRDFTKFSEGHTAEEVVDMLNEYFEIMVGIINRSGGVVDKFIGDAIMAVWGAPTSSGHDEMNAIRACLEMRTALAELNVTRAARGKTPIKIGMGLHSGRAISGTIGSTERMEYTVIGDTVNMAARIEASTKAFGTDLLVSEETARKIGEKFLIEKAGDVEVKGKSEPLPLFKVLGYVGENGESIVVETTFSSYEASGDDKVKIAG